MKGGKRGRPPKTLRSCRHWTAAEDQLLRREWGEIGVRSLRAKLPGRSWCAIRQRAERLGLGFGTPQGKVSLREGANRSGLSFKLFRRVVEAAGVVVKAHPFATTGREGRGHWLVVDWDEARAAVAAWSSGLEKVAAAARARGMTSGCLWCWLRDAGVISRDERRAGVRELPSSVIDRVVAARRTPEDCFRSVRAAAAAHGVEHSMLLRRLVRAGREGGGRGAARPLPKALVEEVLRAAA